MCVKTHNKCKTILFLKECDITQVRYFSGAVCALPEVVGHVVACSALLGLFVDEDGAVEGLSNSLSSMLALLT